VTLSALGEVALDARRGRALPLSIAWRPRPMLRVGKEDVERLRRGQQVAVLKEAVEESGDANGVALALGQDDTPFAIGRLEWDRLTRTFVFSPERNLFVG
jgi:hypothetical protein